VEPADLDAPAVLRASAEQGANTAFPAPQRPPNGACGRHLSSSAITPPQRTRVVCHPSPSARRGSGLSHSDLSLGRGLGNTTSIAADRRGGLALPRLGSRVRVSFPAPVFSKNSFRGIFCRSPDLGGLSEGGDQLPSVGSLSRAAVLRAGCLPNPGNTGATLGYATDWVRPEDLAVA